MSGRPDFLKNFKIQKEIKKMLKLANSVQEEAIFQQKPSYKAFKARQIGHRSEIKLLIQGLADLEFNNECIFWHNKFFHERVCNKDERIFGFHSLCVLYHRIENFEKALEFGQKYLEFKAFSSLDQFKVMTIDHLSDILKIIVVSCNHLELHEEGLNYQKEKLKIDILRYNKSQTKTSLQSQYDVLETYHGLILKQYNHGCFTNAMKTIKSLKLFSLNSKNTNDVRISMDKEDLRNQMIFDPVLRLYTRFPDLGSLGFPKVQESLDYTRKVVLFQLISKICFLKCEILDHLGDKQSCSQWAHLHFEILCDISAHTRAFDNISEVGGLFEPNGFSHMSIVSDTILSVLKLSNCDLTIRKESFLKAYSVLLQSEKFVTHYIGEAVKTHCISTETIMPFVQFCIKNFDEAVSQNPPRWPIEEGRKKLVAFKNSLIIKRRVYTNLLKRGYCLQDLQCDQDV